MLALDGGVEREAALEHLLDVIAESVVIALADSDSAKNAFSLLLGNLQFFEAAAVFALDLAEILVQPDDDVLFPTGAATLAKPLRVSLMAWPPVTTEWI